MTNLAKLLSTTAGQRSGHVAISFEGSVVTYEELDAWARRISHDLVERGVAKGDRIALWLGNHPAFAAAMYGAWRCGAVVVPVHAMLTPPEARHILSDSGAKLAFVGPAQLEAAEELAGALPTLEGVLAVGGPLDGLSPSAPTDRSGRGIVDVGSDDLALIPYTSGTSGTPKGAMLTHENLRANLDQMAATPIGVNPDDAVLCVLPLFHIFGLNVVLNLAVRTGAKVVLHERFDARASIDAIRAEGVTVVAGAPAVYTAWLGTDAPSDAFASVRVAVSGAAPLSKDTLAAFRERFGVTIWEGYGLTETAPALTFTGIGGVAKPGSIGRPVDGVEIRLVDEEGEDVEEGDPGEIVVRGPNVFSGYWGHPEDTEQVFVDGWFRTGDVGVADDDGDLYIVDRRRDMIIVSGFNVYPREVEDVIRRHPNVGDCAVVGDNDDQTGERVHAFVVPDPPGETVTPEQIIEFCEHSLAHYKLPSRVDVVAEIPRNAAGKVLRRLLRER